MGEHGPRAHAIWTAAIGFVAQRKQEIEESEESIQCGKYPSLLSDKH